jgi:long-chain acyl-CoA synthetase
MTVLHPRFHAQNQPDKPALILADTGEQVSYRQLVERADCAARLFLRLGVAEGDTVALLLENHVRYAELIWAAKNSGITYVCIPSQSSVDDAAYIADNCDAKLLVSSARLATIAVGVAQRLNCGLNFLMLDGCEAPFQSYEELLAAEDPLPLSGRRRGPSMLYSSGTTGRPKGVRTPLPDAPPETPPPRQHMLQSRYGFDEQSVLVSPGPLYHAAPGRFMICMQRCGGTVVAFRKFDALSVLRTITVTRATHGLFVPTMFVRMLDLDDSQRRSLDLSTLRCVIHLGAPCPVPVKERMIEWLGPIVEEIYAGTESVGHTMIGAAEWLTHKGSVGRPAPGCVIRVVDDSGRELPPHSPGVVQMKNGNRFEYHKDPDKTRDAIAEDGWGTLGDVGYLDEDGYLYLTDRLSHMIISGGVNIYPQEAESVLSEHPAVADAAVIGVPHAEFGEEVKAVIVPKAYPVTEPEALTAELISWCRSRLSAIKCPRSIDFAQSLPRNESGKLLKRELRAPYWANQKQMI